MSYKIYNNDCFAVLPKLKPQSIDMVLTDLPYGKTKNYWDIILPFDEVWKNINWVIKDNAAIALFGSEPFSSKLRLSNLKYYKYDWIWQKNFCGNFSSIKKQPLCFHENISIFYKKQCNYFPIFGEYSESSKQRLKYKLARTFKEGIKKIDYSNNKGTYPKQIITFQAPRVSKKRLHPTQKPIALLEYLIKTYTKENETVLDFTMGSGSTGVACINTNRNFIGIEKEKKYYDIAKKRLEENKNWGEII